MTSECKYNVKLTSTHPLPVVNVGNKLTLHPSLSHYTLLIVDNEKCKVGDIVLLKNQCDLQSKSCTFFEQYIKLPGLLPLCFGFQDALKPKNKVWLHHSRIAKSSIPGNENDAFYAFDSNLKVSVLINDIAHMINVVSFVDQFSVMHINSTHANTQPPKYETFTYGIHGLQKYVSSQVSFNNKLNTCQEISRKSGVYVITSLNPVELSPSPDLQATSGLELSTSCGLTNRGISFYCYLNESKYAIHIGSDVNFQVKANKEKTPQSSQHILSLSSHKPHAVVGSSNIVRLRISASVVPYQVCCRYWDQFDTNSTVTNLIIIIEDCDHYISPQVPLIINGFKRELFRFDGFYYDTTVLKLCFDGSSWCIH